MPSTKTPRISPALSREQINQIYAAYDLIIQRAEDNAAVTLSIANGGAEIIFRLTRSEAESWLYSIKCWPISDRFEVTVGDAKAMKIDVNLTPENAALWRHEIERQLQDNAADPANALAA